MSSRYISIVIIGIAIVAVLLGLVVLSKNDVLRTQALVGRMPAVPSPSTTGGILISETTVRQCACRCIYRNPSNPSDPTIGDPLCREPYGDDPAEGDPQCPDGKNQWFVEAPRCSALNGQACSPPGFRQSDPAPVHGVYADCGEIKPSAAATE